jgi:hypothetical protein
MKEVEYRYSMIISKSLDATQNIRGQLQSIPFKPDEMIVRQQSFCDFGTGFSSCYVLKCDFTPSTLCCFTTNNVNNELTSVSLNNKIPLSGDIRGERLFYVQNIVDSFVNTGQNAIGFLSVLLEFVKYKEI